MPLPAPFTHGDPLDQDVIAITSPSQIQLHVSTVVNQLHKVRRSLLKDFPLSGGYELPVVDFSEAIGDVVIQTSAQGASLLQLHIIDPYWQLLESKFIDTYDDGWLIPLELTFPVGTNQQWRLCAIDPTSDLTSANLTLTFEDKIVSEMREHLGPVQSVAGELLHQFVGGLVKKAAPDAQFYFRLVNEAADYNAVIQPIRQAQQQAARSAWNQKFNQGFQQGYKDGYAGRPNKHASGGGTDPFTVGYVSGYTAGFAAYAHGQFSLLNSATGGKGFGQLTPPGSSGGFTFDQPPVTPPPGSANFGSDGGL